MSSKTLTMSCNFVRPAAKSRFSKFGKTVHMSKNSKLYFMILLSILCPLLRLLLLFVVVSTFSNADFTLFNVFSVGGPTWRQKWELSLCGFFHNNLPKTQAILGPFSDNLNFNMCNMIMMSFSLWMRYLLIFKNFSGCAKGQIPL